MTSPEDDQFDAAQREALAAFYRTTRTDPGTDAPTKGAFPPAIAALIARADDATETCAHLAAVPVQPAFWFPPVPDLLVCVVCAPIVVHARFPVESDADRRSCDACGRRARRGRRTRRFVAVHGEVVVLAQACQRCYPEAGS